MADSSHANRSESIPGSSGNDKTIGQKLCGIGKAASPTDRLGGMEMGRVGGTLLLHPKEQVRCKDRDVRMGFRRI